MGAGDLIACPFTHLHQSSRNSGKPSATHGDDFSLGTTCFRAIFSAVFRFFHAPASKDLLTAGTSRHLRSRLLHQFSNLVIVHNLLPFTSRAAAALYRCEAWVLERLPKEAGTLGIEPEVLLRRATGRPRNKRLPPLNNPAFLPRLRPFTSRAASAPHPCKAGAPGRWQKEAVLRRLAKVEARTPRSPSRPLSGRLPRLRPSALLAANAHHPCKAAVPGR